MATKKTENDDLELISSSASLTTETKKMLKAMIAEEKPLEFVSTGNVGLDLALTNGKGLPLGSSVLWWADYGCGKTTIVVDACKRLIESHRANGIPFKVLYIDVEDSTGLILSMGMKKYIDSHEFIHFRAPGLHWRFIAQLYEAVFSGDPEEYKGVKLIVIDSVSNVLSDQDLKNNIADGDFGTRSRERSRFYSKYLPMCKERGISSFFISQVRIDQNAGMMEKKEKPAVSKADMHNVDIILSCSKRSNRNSKTVETVFGVSNKLDTNIVTMTSSGTGCKNRYFVGAPSEILVALGRGVQNCYTVRKLLEGHGFLKKNGGYYKFDQALGEAYDVAGKSLREAEVNKIINNNLGEIIELLKSVNKFKLTFDDDVVEDADSLENITTEELEV